MDRIRILYFFEDYALKFFIEALVNKIAGEMSVTVSDDPDSVKMSRERGGSRIENDFKEFIQKTGKTGKLEWDLLIVSTDADREGYNKKKKKFEKYIKPGHPYEDKVVYAIPNPHIEFWYLMDQRAVKRGIGIDKAPDIPKGKIKKDFYKKILGQTIKESGIGSLDPKVYAGKIVENIEDIDALFIHNAGFQHFVEDLRRKFGEYKRVNPPP